VTRQARDTPYQARAIYETLERPGASVSASHLGVSASHLGLSAVCRAQGPGPATPTAPRPGGTAAERLLLARPASGFESGRRPPAPACPAAPPWGPPAAAADGRISQCPTRSLMTR
jgi:hypothetical protein